MLPPLFLDVEPHHVVLDMCAAPGSKVRLSWLVAIKLTLHDIPLVDIPASRVTPLFSVPARVEHTSWLVDSQ